MVGLSFSTLVRKKNGTKRWRNRRSSWSKEHCTWRRPRTCSPLQRDQRKWPKTRSAVEDVWVLALIHQQIINCTWCSMDDCTFLNFLSPSVRKELIRMTLSTMTLMRTCHWRKRRGERAAAAVSRRARMERRSHARRGGGECAAGSFILTAEQGT